MTKLNFLLAATVACAASVNVYAKTSDQASLDSAVRRLHAAMIAANGAELKALTTSTLSYGHSNASVQNQQVYIDTITSGKTHYKRIDLTEPSVTLAGDNAIVRDHFSTTVESDGKQTDVELDQLMVWKKAGNDWKLLARQGFKH
jgi:ketosteroid isomerase-like protein